METKNFQRRKENFSCEHCGSEVTGNGYTNHCPQCLWSKHVDVQPGDRANSCRGVMRPIGVVGDGEKRKILHECTVCHEQKRCKVHSDDNQDALIAIMSAPLYKQ